MQNAGQQYGQGVAPSHQGAPYGHTESSSSSTGSITSSLRQFRKKDVDKQHVNDTTASTGESHVARVAPHNHYPPRTSDNYRYPPQFPDYSLSSQVKYSEITDLHALQDPVPPTVIQKPKVKEYMDACSVQQTHMKQSYPDHLNGQQYAPESNLHPHHQYPHKEHQVHALYKPESQYFPKEAQYQQLPHHQMQKYNMPTQMRKYPPENDFLSKLRRIHPSMARSIMSDHHLQESQSSYQAMDQSRMYPHQNQRYMNYPTSLQGNPYPHNYMPPQNYTNYPASCSYNRPPQMTPRFPSINPHERSISPRRGYSDNLPIPPINYTALPQKISPNYPQYNAPEYAQHYQHRRAPQEYYQQHCRTTQYLPHQMTSQEITESRVTVSDSIKQYIENWADEETASEMNQMENNRLCKENLRVRENQSTETVYMINASELQYLENGIPLVTSENGIPLVTSENGQYIIKSGVSIDNTTGMVRIMDKTNQIDSTETNGERVVNLHIMDNFKPDCMLANKPNELSQRQDENLYSSKDKPKVVIHQNAIIQPSHQNAFKGEVTQSDNKIGNSLPVITETDISQETDPLEKFEESIFKECKKETADKNCSPINMEQMEGIEDFKDPIDQTAVICTTDALGQSHVSPNGELEDDSKLKNMPIIELVAETGTIKCERVDTDDVNENYMETEGSLNEEDAKVEKLEEKTTPNKTDCGNIDEKAIPLDNIETTKNETKNHVETEKLASEESIKKELVIEEQMQGDKASVKEENITKEVTIESVDQKEQLMQAEECSVKEETITKEVTIKGDDQKAGTKYIEKIDTATNIEEKDENIIPTANTGTNIEERDEHIVRTANSEDIAEASPIQQDVKLEETKEIIEDTPDNASEDIKSEETANTNSGTLISSEIIDKPKRSRRIFSVDDIINKIGTNNNKSKNDKELTERRRSIHTTREFLEKEIDHSGIFALKLDDKEKRQHIEKEIDEIDVTPSEISDEEKCEAEEAVRAMENCAEETQSREVNNVEDSFKEANMEEASNSCADSDTNPDLNITQAEDEVMVENVVESTIENSENITDEVVTIPSIVEAEIPINEKSVENSVICEAESEVTPDLNDDEAPSSNEVHYRNAIRVEESSVLLEIAGELVEINVVTVNGKKVITVVPLSETTVVDLNDNYETLENGDVETHTKIGMDIDCDETITEVASVDEVIPETEIIESTSEIIIGMDISLEEEIQLDLEKPPVLCTKAAKKAYENDLQIPSITTSEDVNEDNNKRDCYNVNDKVSSSKEQSQPKEKSEKKRTDKIRSSNKVHEAKQEKKLSDKLTENDRKALNDLMKVRKIKKDDVQRKEVEEDFVPFKDLVKARNLKKQKLQRMKSSENVSADSTNKIDHEGSNDVECDAKEKNIYPEKKNEEVDKSKGDTFKVYESKSKDHKQKNYRRPPKSEDKKEDNVEKNKDAEENIVDVSKTEAGKVSSVEDKSGISEQDKDKCVKKVTFGSVDFKTPDELSKNGHHHIRTHKLEDPRLKKKPGIDVIVPSVSELLKENAVVENTKKRLSLEEYIRRKRKLSANQDEPIAKTKKIDAEEKIKPVVEKVNTDKFKLHRPKSLDDLKLLSKPRDAIMAKRKFSLEENYCRPNYLDWEDTQSPKTNLTSREKSDKRLSEFSGLINNNKSKIVIDINDLNAKPTISESSEDEVLQIYKEQVDSKLNSLNIQIPRVVKPPNNVLNPYSNPESNNLMERFLNNEKITLEEMEKIKKIISFKRLVQQLNKIKSPDLMTSPLNPSYEIRKNCTEKDMKLHLKKVSDKKKRRFRNLYTDPTTESDSDVSETKETGGAYSVVQSNCYQAAGVPKLIIKRKPEMPVPIVRLERLDLDLLAGKKRKIN